MKIALYVPTWPPGDTPNGIVTYAAQLVPALRRLGHEVFVVTPRKAQDSNDPRVIDLCRFAPTQSFWHHLLAKLDFETAAFNFASSEIASAIRDLVEKHDLDVFEI